jgi:hypothetical protein
MPIKEQVVELATLVIPGGKTAEVSYLRVRRRQLRDAPYPPTQVAGLQRPEARYFPTS